MAVRAQLADGTTLEFPDGTHPDVVKLTVKRRLGLAGPAPKPAAPAEEDLGLGLPTTQAPPAIDTSKSVMEGMGAPQSVVRLPKNVTSYNTPLSDTEEQQFQAQYPNYTQDTADYDLRGAWKAGVKPGPDGHMPDTYKKPNHITFSNESIYHGKDGNVGGQWQQQPNKSWSFTPSSTNLSNTPMAQLQSYFQKNEPGNKLVLPAQALERALSGRPLTQPTNVEAAQNAMSAPPTSMGPPVEAPRSPSLIPAGPPGSLSYAASGAGSGIESFFAMPAALVGAGAGAVGAGAAAIPDIAHGRFEQAAEGVRQGMAEGGQRMTLDRPIFAPTPALNQAVGDVFDFIRSKVGEGGEALEELRGAVAQGIVPDWLKEYVKARPEAARTLAEYGFDATIITSPMRGMKALAERKYFPDFGPNMGRDAPPPEPPAGPAPIIEGQARRIDENAPRIPPIAPETPAAAPSVPAAPVAPAPPARGSMADLEAVMGSEKPLGEIRAEQVAQQAAAAAPAIQEAAQQHHEQQQVVSAATQIAMRAAGIPDQGQRATVTWPDGEIQTVTVLDPYATGAQVQTDEGDVLDLNTDMVKFGPAAAGENLPGAPIVVEHPHHIAQAGQRVDQEATDAMKDAGNYRKGHIAFQGMDITIENPKGSVRRSTDPANPWETTMPAHYGYLKRTGGADGEQVDVYLGDNVASDRVFVIDQIDPKTGNFDEHKVMLGFTTKQHAVATFHTAFDDASGPSRIGAVTPMSIQQFKDDFLKGHDLTKPYWYKQPRPAAPQPGEQHATTTGQEQGGAGAELPRVSPRQDVQAHGGEVRKGERGEADGGGGTREGPPAVVTQERPVDEAGTAGAVGRPGDRGVSQPEPAVSAEPVAASPTGMTVEKRQHTKTGADLWLVKLPERVSREDYLALNAKAKRMGGYYSKFTKGFNFDDEAKAREFAGINAPKTPGQEVHDLAMATQREAGWNPDWPFIPQDLGNADFRKLIRDDPGLSDAEKQAIFDAGRKLGVVPAEAKSDKGMIVPTRRPDGSIEYVAKPVTPQVPPLAGMTPLGARPEAPSSTQVVPKKASTAEIYKLAAKVDTMSLEEKQAAEKWLADEIRLQEEEGRRIADECAGLL